MPKASSLLRPKAELRPLYDIQDAMIYVQFQQGLFYKSLNLLMSLQ